ENNRFRRLGDVRERAADIQIIAATNRNLLQSVEQMKFREDLYYRISTFHLHIPPLRERRNDIPALANSLLKDLAKDLARDQQELSRGAEMALQEYLWPGNIRELRNVLERLALTCESRIIEARDLGLAHGPAAVAVVPRLQMSGAAGTLAELERQHILRVLHEESGKMAQAPGPLGIPRRTLDPELQGLGLGLESAKLA